MENRNADALAAQRTAIRSDFPQPASVHPISRGSIGRAAYRTRWGLVPREVAARRTRVMVLHPHAGGLSRPDRVMRSSVARLQAVKSAGPLSATSAWLRLQQHRLAGIPPFHAAACLFVLQYRPRHPPEADYQ
ncbi:hypothetical protein E4U27_005992 [Claviceps purpurea]|nr:hypothetical protein E4U27_005992 [Claviceps purpurea]